jgi:RNA polymerase sigma factor (sigma-70 family)
MEPERPDTGAADIAVTGASGPETLYRLLERLASPPRHQQILTRYIRRYGNLPQATVEEGVQEAFAKVLKHYGRRVPPITTIEQAERVLFTVIRNTLIDAVRRTRADGFDDQGDSPTDPDEETADGDVMSEQVKISEKLDIDDLYDAVMAELDPKYRAIVAQVLGEAAPADLAAIFGQDGYRLRHWARVLFCRALGKVAARGNDRAADLHLRAGCPRLLKSVASASRG